jgi:amidohydrolase
MNRLNVGLIATAACLTAAPINAEPLRDAIASDATSLTAIYRDLHAHPELGFQEVRTSAILAAEAKRLGFTVTTGVGKTGVIAVIKNGPGKTVLIRADMDALPLVEQTGLSFASKVRAVGPSGAENGVMHACGHDTHMTAWIGTARRLVAMKDKWSGTVVMIGQPAEETVGGAQAMIADGLFTRFPKPDYLLAFHNSSGAPAGTISYTNGFALANVDSVDIKVRGVGGHGASPHLTKDPIVLASRIVTALQTLVARETNPLEPAVVTVGSFHAGSKHNIISDEAKLQLTVRSYSSDVRKNLLDGISRIVRGEAIAAGLPDNLMPVVAVSESTPATFNTSALTTRVAAVLTERFGKDRVKASAPWMASEDFSYYWLADKSVESLIFMVGGVPQDKWDAAKGDVTKLASLHSPFWAPDAEKTIATATEAMTAATLDLLAK